MLSTLTRSRILSCILIVFIALLDTGCSVYKAATQPPPADLQGIGVGTRRSEIITRLGAPKFSDTNPQGNKEDTFEFFSGLHSASKIRILPYLAADFFTICLAEIVLWPIELTVMEKAVCVANVSYDGQQKVEAIVMSKKDGVQGC